MCIKYFRYAKRFPAKSKTFGQIKAIAQSVEHSPLKMGPWRIWNENAVNVGIEAHFWRISRAKTKRVYSRKHKIFEIESFKKG